MPPPHHPDRAASLLELVEQAAFIGVWTMDLALGQVHWSAQLARLHGAPAGYSPPPGEALAFYAPEWQPLVEGLLQRCVQQGEPFDVEAQIITLARRRAWVRLIGRVVAGEAGTPGHLEGALQEIAPPAHSHGTLLRHTVSMGGAMGSGEAFVTVDSEGRLSFLNEQAEQLLMGAAEGMVGRNIWSSFQKTVRLAIEGRFREALASRTTLEFEELDAWQSRWIEVRGYPFGGGLAVHLRDVSSRRRSQEQLRLLESSIARLNDIVIITEAGPFNEPGPPIVFVNEAFERRTGYTRDEVIGHTPRLLQGPATDRRTLDTIREALEQWTAVRVDLVNYNKAGEPFWVDLGISPVWDEARKLTHWVAVGRDISDRKMAEEKIQHLAFYDQLTQLPNRQLLMDRLDGSLADGGGLRDGALMFIDLDNFKVLNDTLGHQKGDLLLQQVAQRLRSCVARHDTVARLGGDEFVILLVDRSDKHFAAEHAKAVADRILAVLGEPYVFPGYVHHSTCSIGVTLFAAGTPLNVSELLKQADLAMYQAKAMGRNAACFFDPAMQASATASAALAADLREACREGQFVVDYQPQFSAEGRMTGVEALIRWRHPRRGMVPPADFIPAAEETSLIIPIGRWVLEAACAQLALWQGREGFDHLCIAVNVSARQFRHPEFVDEVQAAIGRSGIRPGLLKLELTESLLAQGAEITVAKMGSLKAMGVTLSLDDFGMGYSSLSYLKRLPLDQLKIDREFVRNILLDANDAAIATTIIQLAASLHLNVIAEGIETRAQRDFLLERGCRSFQGHYYCAALPPAQLEAFVAEGRGIAAPATAQGVTRPLS